MKSQKFSWVRSATLEDAEGILLCLEQAFAPYRDRYRAMRFYEKNGFWATGEVGSFFGMELFAYRKVI